MTNNYHSRVIDTFCKNPEIFSGDLGFFPTIVKRNVSMSIYGDIDIILEGEGKKALIEVKSHPSLANRFEFHQLPKYRAYDPHASVFTLSGTTSKSLNLLEFELIRYHPKKDS